MLVRFKGVRTETEVRTSMMAGPIGPGWYGWYGSWYRGARGLSRRASPRSRRRCSTCYTKKLVWTGVTETYDPVSFRKDAGGLADMIVGAIAVAPADAEGNGMKGMRRVVAALGVAAAVAGCASMTQRVVLREFQDLSVSATAPLTRVAIVTIEREASARQGVGRRVRVAAWRARRRDDDAATVCGARRRSTPRRSSSTVRRSSRPRGRPAPMRSCSCSRRSAVPIATGRGAYRWFDARTAPDPRTDLDTTPSSVTELRLYSLRSNAAVWRAMVLAITRRGGRRRRRDRRVGRRGARQARIPARSAQGVRTASGQRPEAHRRAVAAGQDQHAAVVAPGVDLREVGGERDVERAARAHHLGRGDRREAQASRRRASTARSRGCSRGAAPPAPRRRTRSCSARRPPARCGAPPASVPSQANVVPTGNGASAGGGAAPGAGGERGRAEQRTAGAQAGAGPRRERGWSRGESTERRRHSSADPSLRPGLPAVRPSIRRALVPAARAVDDRRDGQHQRNLDQYADDRGERRAANARPNRLIAAATASSKKFDAPISADGPATRARRRAAG